jgi:hypothetical protein
MFKANPGKQFMRTQKKKSQRRASGVAEGVGSEFKRLYNNNNITKSKSFKW